MAFGIKLKVWGDFACFTRPEMKVERVSYDVMTPSGARGIMEAVYWKPLGHGAGTLMSRAQGHYSQVLRSQSSTFFEKFHRDTPWLSYLCGYYAHKSFI